MRSKLCPPGASGQIRCSKSFPAAFSRATSVRLEVLLHVRDPLLHRGRRGAVRAEGRRGAGQREAEDEREGRAGRPPARAHRDFRRVRRAAFFPRVGAFALRAAGFRAAERFAFGAGFSQWFTASIGWPSGSKTKAA